jgi:hypothetical protein
MRSHSFASVVLLTLALVTLTPMASAQTGGIPPVATYSDPNVTGLINLPGDLVTVRYSAGNLDRAARAQFLLEPMVRVLNRWSGANVVLSVYTLTQEEWRLAQIPVAFGVPVRIGRTGLALPAEGNDEVVRLWSQLKVSLPASQLVGSGAMTTPQHASSLLMADQLSMVLVGEIYTDHLRLQTNEPWLRGLISHVIADNYLRKENPEMHRDLEQLYSGVQHQRAPRALAASDYRTDIGLADYLWFHAQFFQGAQILLRDEGRGSIKKMRKLTRRGDGILLSATLMDEYKDLRAWFGEAFSTVSMVRR